MPRDTLERPAAREEGGGTREEGGMRDEGMREEEALNKVYPKQKH